MLARWNAAALLKSCGKKSLARENKRHVCGRASARLSPGGVTSHTDFGPPKRAPYCRGSLISASWTLLRGKYALVAFTREFG